jgi:glycosyltransferase involved in cell wall biosynthesis
MKYSVLLPTRGGGQYLSGVIHSILDDPYEDVELVVSDNANTDETQEVLALFSNDPRLKVTRTEKLLSVNENWNHVLDKSSGDYILMLGDDDCLLPGYFEKMDNVLRQYDYPECVTYNYCNYVFPGAMCNDVGYYKTDAFKFGRKYPSQGGVISLKNRFTIIEDMFSFKATFPLLMSPTLIARKAMERIRGEVFQPPYPDYYALTSLLMLAETWVYHAESMLVVGITPKSHGSYQYSSDNETELRGLEYLGIDKEAKAQDPGSPTINQMNVWLENMKGSYPDKLDSVEMDRPNYLLRLTFFWCLDYQNGSISLKDLLFRFKELSGLDWLGMLSTGLFSATCWERLWRELRYMGSHRIQKVFVGARPLGREITDHKKFRDWLGSQ